MKILSVFHRGNEIGLHTNFFGKKTITYNGNIVLEEFNLFRNPIMTFRVGSDEYHVKMCYNNHGWLSADVWCGDEPILLGLGGHYERPRSEPSPESEYV